MTLCLRAMRQPHGLSPLLHLQEQEHSNCSPLAGQVWASLIGPLLPSAGGRFRKVPASSHQSSLAYLCELLPAPCHAKPTHTTPLRTNTSLSGTKYRLQRTPSRRGLGSCGMAFLLFLRKTSVFFTVSIKPFKPYGEHQTLAFWWILHSSFRRDLRFLPFESSLY